ncbi:MAG: hypothetical protein JWM80_4382 [Cyanobacteria bacterium RYN_339]|nr:hypothetical protein [Cyanobacteria bacterium RYN_339]
MIGFALALALAAAPEGYADTELARFGPGIPGSIAIMRRTGRDGRDFGTTTTVVQRIEHPETELTRMLVRYRNVQGAQPLVSAVWEYTLRPELIEWSKLDSNREPAIQLHTPLQPGTRWTYHFGTGEVRSEIVAIEPVAVPAGTYQGALHVRASATLHDGKEALESVNDFWYVRDVGLVKWVAYSTRDGNPALMDELVSFKRDPVPTRRP